ncbi:MAG: PHB depolymerase family esterase [Micromonosporaceae bacterium]|nr:PHB depolymerase family esterase [Micromonosporaceae bacterium]
MPAIRSATPHPHPAPTRTRPPRRSAFGFAAAAVLVVLATASLAQPAAAATLEEVTGFGSNPGNLQMFRYVPDGLPAGRPLVVALHGCTQSAAAYDNEPGWTTLAERHGFALVLPQQRSVNNSSRCFNWFEVGDTARGSGETLSIKQMVDRMKADFGSDPGRVFVTGLSAGGAMTAVMMAAYPDVFAGGGVVAGLPYRCATNVSQAFSCMNPGVDLTPAQWGDKVRAASSHTGPWPTLSVWHGTSDTTVAPANLRELVDQWTNVHGADRTPDRSDTVAGYPHKVYQNAAGRSVVETYEITGMSHGQPIDPGTRADQCGAPAAYILDVNICAAYHMVRFWGLDAGGPGPSPTTGTTVTFANRDPQDGYVKANADGSASAVGTLEAYNGLAIGRGSDGKHNRTVLSFDTSGLPDGATVTRAYLTVAHRSSSGDPWSSPAGNRLVVDVKSGCFGGCAIEATDWAAAPTTAATAAIGKFTSGIQRSADFGASGLAAIHKAGTTQVKLRFAQNPTSTAYLFIDRGATATLTVSYR